MNRLFSSERRNPRQALPLLLLLSAMAIALPRFSSITPHADAGLSAGAAANVVDASSAGITSSAATAAMRVHVDPETGELVPAVGNEAARLRAGMAPSHSVKGLQVITRPNGGRSVHLEGRFMESYVATVDPTGRMQFDCVPEGQGERFIHESATAVPAGAVER